MAVGWSSRIRVLAGRQRGGAAPRSQRTTCTCCHGPSLFKSAPAHLIFPLLCISHFLPPPPAGLNSAFRVHVMRSGHSDNLWSKADFRRHVPLNMTCPRCDPTTFTVPGIVPGVYARAGGGDLGDLLEFCPLTITKGKKRVSGGAFRTKGQETRLRGRRWSLDPSADKGLAAFLPLPACNRCFWERTWSWGRPCPSSPRLPVPSQGTRSHCRSLGQAEKTEVRGTFQLRQQGSGWWARMLPGPPRPEWPEWRPI